MFWNRVQPSSDYQKTGDNQNNKLSTFCYIKYKKESNQNIKTIKLVIL